MVRISDGKAQPR